MECSCGSKTRDCGMSQYKWGHYVWLKYSRCIECSKAGNYRLFCSEDVPFNEMTDKHVVAYGASARDMYDDRTMLEGRLGYVGRTDISLTNIMFPDGGMS